jgi:heme-degrading monooxygenase HmoA
MTTHHHFMSMQQIRFASKEQYEMFQMFWRQVEPKLKAVDGFVSVTWWEHPEIPGLYLEASIWRDRESVNAWHAVGTHGAMKKWARETGGLMEASVVRWEATDAVLWRVCPVCGHHSADSFDLDHEIASRAVPCHNCGFIFPQAKPDDLHYVYKNEDTSPVAQTNGAQGSSTVPSEDTTSGVAT